MFTHVVAANNIAEQAKKRSKAGRIRGQLFCWTMTYPLEQNKLWCPEAKVQDNGRTQFRQAAVNVSKKIKQFR